MEDDSQTEDSKRVTVWTIGHSTRSVEEFFAILQAHSMEALVDVRSFPGSRRYPQFNKGSLSATLAEVNVDYHHMPLLGGRRKPRSDSKNTAWHSASFRAYADYMESQEFARGIKELLELASVKKTVIMCAEAVWWRCHRSLISDYLKSGGLLVIHIIDATHADEHPFTSAASIVDGELSYAGLLEKS
ncbi:MAG: DUF488 family protein [Pyrinomonadaceae bacterium]